MRWKIEKQYEGLKIRDYLRKVHGLSRRILISVKNEGKIIVNGSEVLVNTPVKEGDLLEISFPKEQVATYMKAENMPLNIVYEDDTLLVIEKVAGMATIPSRNHPSGTVANGVLAYYALKEIPFTIHVVTRLDRDTSGLVLIAKHRYSHSLLSKSQKLGKVKRIYRAIVEGNLEQERGIIDLPIGRKENSIIERQVSESGKRAITNYKTIKHYPSHTFVEIDLETGRTHQIRVHFSHIGHPLAGDDLYGGSKMNIKRQALHCYKLRFEHPFTKEIIELESKLPADMEKLTREWGTIEAPSE